MLFRVFDRSTGKTHAEVQARTAMSAMALFLQKKGYSEVEADNDSLYAPGVPDDLLTPLAAEPIPEKK